MTAIVLDHVVYAAQHDPGASQGHTSYRSDVLPVEQALNRKGLLAATYVDGSYGTLTLDAYRRLQVSYGYSGADADGIPGHDSLTRLGNETGLFTLAGGTPVPPPPPANVWRQRIDLNAVQYNRVADYSCSQVIKDVCAQAGVPTTFWLPGGLTVASRESSFQVNAINNYDLNAHGPIVADGYPEYCSRGAWQFIAPTFASNHHPGTSFNIYDGHALFWAFINYTMSSYGVSRDGHDLAARVQQADPNRSPRGY